MQPLPLHDEDWEYVRTLLPADLEESARKTNALQRCRNVPDAAALIRMALAYAVSDLSLKDVAAWASALEVAQIKGPGYFIVCAKPRVGWCLRIRCRKQRVDGLSKAVLGDRAYATAPSALGKSDPVVRG